MRNLTDYRGRRDLLEGWYDRVIDAENLLQADVEGLREDKSNLHAGRFVVAVCGEMNSGKSTLLNALLFEDEVLPSHVTTMTAKIALMEGDTRERIEATLYTPDEFQRVKEKCSSDIQAKEELDKARQTALDKGLEESDLLTEPARVITEDGLGGLTQFAAVCSKGGIYSLYVKAVQLWADRCWLHQVTVADTPGTDDPNPERDRVTREWIQRADAVVYVTFAGAAVKDMDVKFIDEHLAHIDPGRRIIAVNKIDLVPNREAVWNQLRNVRDSDDLRRKNLFGNDDQIVLVSGLGALISAMQRDQRPLSDEMKWHAGKLSASGHLEPERHGLEKLRDLIERRIIATKGEGIIQTHQRKLDSLFERAVRRLSRDEAVLKNHIDTANASREDRTKEIKKMERSIDSISDHISDSRGKLNIELDKSLSNLDETISEVTTKVHRTVSDEIDKVQQIDNLAGTAKWAVSSTLFRERQALTDAIRDLVKQQIEPVLNEAESQLSEKLLASGDDAYAPRFHLLPVCARTICQDAEAKLIEILDRDIDKEVRDNTNWGKRILDIILDGPILAKGIPYINKKKELEAARERLKPWLGDRVRKALDMVPEHTRREVENLGQKAIRSMEDGCRDVLERRRDLLDELEKGDLDDQETEAQLTRKIEVVRKRLHRVQKLQLEYQNEVLG